MATPNSRGIGPIAAWTARTDSAHGWKPFRAWPALLLAALLTLAARAETAPDESQQQAVFAARARKVFADARVKFQADTNNTEAAWQFARAAFDAGEFAADSTERAEIASSGIAACRQVLARDNLSAPAHYYLGMNLGQLARTKGLGALKLVNEMEREFDAARQLDERLDYAGADRNLGLLYRDAPSTFSIGNRSKAKVYLRRAVEVAPDYPENRLNLIDAYLDWGDRNGASREFKALEKIWTEAKEKLAGADWASTWADWEKRFKKVKKKVEDPAKPIESPRGAE